MNCAGCGYLEIISVPDWFKCKKYGYEGPTQTDLRRLQENSMEKVKVSLHYRLWVNCPKCNEDFDLVDQDDDNVVSTAIFTNKWGDLEGYEIYCPKCEHEFEIKEIEY